MKKVLSLVFAFILIVSMTTTVFAAKGDKLTIKEVKFDDKANPDVAAAPRGGDKDLKKLWDGDVMKDNKKHDASGVVLFTNKKPTAAGDFNPFTIIIELDKVSTIGGLDIAMFHEQNTMIGLSKDNKIKVEKSTDGTAFFPAEDLTFEGKTEATVAAVLETSMKFKKAFDAKFLRLTFSYDTQPGTPADGKVIYEFLGFTEFAVIEGEKSSEPAPDTEDTTPETSDFYIVFVAAAVASIAGSVLVTRKARRA